MPLDPTADAACDPGREAVSCDAGTEARSLQRPLLWVAMVAIAVRLPHLLEVVGSAFFDVPILDEAFYDLAAQRLADGTSIGDLNPGFRPLLYPALLALCRLLSADHGTFLALTAQHALGIFTCLLVTSFAGRLFQRATAAVVAGILYALAAPPLFYEGRLLITTLFTFLVVAFLVVLGHCRLAGHREWRSLRRLGPWLAAGALLAVVVQARANALVFVLAFPLVSMFDRARSAGRVQRHLPWIAATTATLVGLTLIAALQTPWLGAFRLLPGAGGVNLYLGNERGADGMVPRQDRHTVYGDVYRDSVQLFAADEYRLHMGRDGSPAEVSRYWLGRSAQEFRADPAGRLSLLARKAWLLVWPPEVPNNLSYSFVAEHESAILRHLPVRWGWLLPLAAAGAWIAFRRRGRASDGLRLAWLSALGLFHAVTVIAFFVAGRFRIPLWPLAAILAAGASVAIADTARRRGSLRLDRHMDRRDAGIALALTLAVFGIGHVRWPGVELPSQARDFFYRSLAHQDSGQFDAALADARRAAALEPDNPQALFQLGTVALALEDWTLARDALFDASRMLHVEPRPFNNLGIALEGLGHHGDAYAAYLRALEVGPEFSPAWTNAAHLELRAGRVDLAASKIARAEELERAAGRQTVYALTARAFLARDLGHDQQARRAWDAAVAEDEAVARQLLRDNARRLDLRLGTQASDDRDSP